MVIGLFGVRFIELRGCEVYMFLGPIFFLLWKPWVREVVKLIVCGS